MHMELEIENNHFILHHYKAIYWIEERALLIADMHLGKYMHFRSNGIPLPVSKDTRALNRLQELIIFFSPEKLIFLGDLFHSAINDSWKDFVFFRHTYPDIRFNLVLGNHDIIDTAIIEDAGLSVYRNLVLQGGVSLTHYPESPVESINLNISGHLHPGVLLKGSAKQHMKSPCFWLQKGQLVLPAFGDFTGMHMVRPAKEHRIFVPVNENVMEIFSK